MWECDVTPRKNSSGIFTSVDFPSRLTWSNDLSNELIEWTATCKFLARVATVLFKFLYLRIATTNETFYRDGNILYGEHEVNGVRSSLQKGRAGDKFSVGATQNEQLKKWLRFCQQTRKGFTVIAKGIRSVNIMEIFWFSDHDCT